MIVARFLQYRSGRKSKIWKSLDSKLLERAPKLPFSLLFYDEK
jgi:hypothetical protein